MIAKLEKVPFGSHEKLSRKIAYSIKKMNEGKCIFLYDNAFFNDTNKLYDEMIRVGNLNQRTEKKFNEVSINLAPGEHLDDDKFRTLAIEYMSRLGYGNSCYNVWRHFDKEHEHVHILFTTIDYEGNWINDYNTRRRSQFIARELEKEHGLRQVIYNKFKRESLGQIKAREYYYYNALRKGLRAYNSKEEIKKVIPEEIINTIMKSSSIQNEMMFSLMGEELYEKVGNILQKYKLFNTLYKEELLKQLDSIYDISLSKEDFFQRIIDAGLYVRMVSQRGEHSYIYGLPDAAVYFKDRQLPMRFRYECISKFGKRSRSLLDSEQKNCIYNKIYLALGNSKNFDEFRTELSKLCVTLLEYKNESGIYDLGFRLEGIENPFIFNAENISSRFAYRNLYSYFEGRGDPMPVYVRNKNFIRDLAKAEFIYNGVLYLMEDHEEKDEIEDLKKRKKKKGKSNDI